MSIFIPLIIGWAVLALVVLVLAMRRKSISSQEDDVIHLSGGEAAEEAAKKQVAIAARLDAIDKWGKLLTIVLAASGLLIACYYLYVLFTSKSSDPFAG
jgi:hypothetical protein